MFAFTVRISSLKKYSCTEAVNLLKYPPSECSRGEIIILSAKLAGIYIRCIEATQVIDDLSIKSGEWRGGILFFFKEKCGETKHPI